MSILWRSWLIFTAVIATVLTVLATLAVLQHNAILSDLIRQRLSVVAQTTAASFRSVVDLGLPLSMMRNADLVLSRAHETDPTITAISVFNPAGIVVYSTDEDGPGKVSPEILQAQLLADDKTWSVETPVELDSGFTVTSSAGDAVGGVVVAYPKHDFNAQRRSVALQTGSLAVALLAIFSAAAFLILRIRLSGASFGLKRLEQVLSDLRDPAPLNRPPDTEEHRDAARLGFLREEIEDLEAKLVQADHCFDTANAELADIAGSDAVPPTTGTGKAQEEALTVESAPETSLARLVARQLTPWAALLIIAAALALGALTIRSVSTSIEPELASRTSLIGTIVSANIQRAVSAGVPLEGLVGAEQYFGGLLSNLPEVAYIAVATGRIILEAGDRIDPYLAPPRARKDVLTHPIVSGGEEIGYIIIDIDPAFVIRKFRSVFLDLGVVVLVTILLAFEVLVVMMSVSLMASFNRLHHLVGLQATGDFSKRINVGGKNVVDRLGAFLSGRAEALNGMFVRAHTAVSARTEQRSDLRALDTLGGRFGLDRSGPRRLSFAYLNDIRLPLFLFAAADELPLSFFPLFTRAADNPWPWLDQGVVISLPLVGYLVAIMAASPFARLLAVRFGYRNLLLFAMVPTLLAHIGLFQSTNVAEIVFFRTLTGFGYAIVTLACQDYVLDVVPKARRDQSLGIFSAVLFGGIFCGTALGGILADRLGQATVFLLSASLVAASALLILRLLAGGRHGRIGAAVPGFTRLAGIWVPLKNLSFSALVFGVAIPANVIMQAFISYLVALYLNELGASASDIGRTLMLYFLVIALVSPIVARVAGQRVEPSQTALAGALLSGLALVLAAFWPMQLSIVLAVLIAGFSHGLIRGAQVSIAMTIAETELDQVGSGRVLGALRTLERGGSILGLLAVAFLGGVVGYPGAIGAMGIWCLGGAALFAIASFLNKKDQSTVLGRRAL